MMMPSALRAARRALALPCSPLLLTLLLMGSATSAAAQAEHDGPFLLVTADASGNAVEDPQGIAQALEEALSQAGQTTLGDAESRLAQYHSKPAEDLPKDVMQKLREQIDSVTRDLAMGDLPKAIHGMEAIDGLHHKALVQLNREAEQARRLFTACVAMGVMLNDNGKPGESKTRLQHCAATFPGYRLSKDAFSPAAIKLYREAVAGIDPVTLRVDNARPDMPCTVRFNGLNVGMAPAQLRVQRGWASVQLECNERPGRVHQIMLVDEQQRLSIDPGLEQALATAPTYLALHYGSDSQKRREAVDHTVALTGAVRAKQALLATPSEGGHYELLWVSHEGQRALARQPWDGQPETLPPAVKALLEAPALAAKLAEQPVAFAAASSQHDADGAPETLAGLPEGLMWAWPAVGVAWAGTLGLSLYALNERANDREYGVYLLDPAPADSATSTAELATLKAQYDDLLPLTYALSATSNVLAVASSALLLPESDGMPAWGWISGGVGLGLAATGFVILATASPCDIAENCINTGAFTRDTLLPATLLIHAVGPLSIPLTYLISEALGTSVQTRVTATPTSAQVALAGSF